MRYTTSTTRSSLSFVDDRRKESFNLRFQHATGQLENTARLKQAKQDLARGLTVARERGTRRRSGDAEKQDQ